MIHTLVKRTLQVLGLILLGLIMFGLGFRLAITTGL